MLLSKVTYYYLFIHNNRPPPLRLIASGSQNDPCLDHCYQNNMTLAAYNLQV